MTTSVPTYKGWRGIQRAFATPSAATMALLGFGSGLPFLLIASQTLSVRLRDVGLDLQDIGFISLASFFYLLKFLWAPLIDRYAFPLTAFLGRRRSWLLVAQIGVTIGLFALAFSRPDLSVTGLVGWVLFASFWGATQDSVVDAYRIEVAPDSAQAALAATYTLGYRIGLILGGAGALYMAEYLGWTWAYVGMAALMLVPIVTTLLCREPDRPEATVVRRVDVSGAFWQPISSFFSSNGLALGIALLLFVGLYRFPDQVIGVMAGPFYLDSGFTKADIATVSKLFGVWMGIVGAFAGGAAVAAFGFRRMLLVAALGVALSNLAFLLMAHNPGKLWAFYAALSADNLFQGFAASVLVAFMSSLTDRNFTATQYALLVSLANLPGKFAGAVSGSVINATSYSTFFILSALTVIPTLLLLAWLWPRLLAHDRRPD
ncbi:signal transduction protein [Xanthomonas phaseoli pv. phaseoli]|uniref:Signal transduction protein n=5 Tax=Xanthomonas TaxID=338 RepID=A0A1T1NZD9_9XANT|nr:MULTISPECIES: MFS transporter [Xanthomonas]OOW85776.1 signal transduction protein [Xanthomonas campestris pv. vitiswoodrowii]OOW96752.1 signal transduction protein [Xanthomonas campestris pv. vitiscarnosae]WVK04507.1 MFS transporter [Xanthomonas campestris pv. olitorii]ARV24991.1 signal transduction protein [Xanthomonas citri pv. glycines str. 12-2]EWC49810.1 signal transduction protein [Xanthomonas citri pv. glycines str. 8ra]